MESDQRKSQYQGGKDDPYQLTDIAAVRAIMATYYPWLVLLPLVVFLLLTDELDYVGTGRLSAKTFKAIVSGVCKACKENGCALLGGETAELPGFYGDGEYDMAGFAVGVVERVP